LLAVTIPDLKPSSQDTSAFYLENIYQLFANQNTSNGLTPSILAKPTPFSPPRYVVWVNSLWSLALLISLAGAMFVTLGQRWALQYVAHTQNKEYSPETRARFHAKYIKEYGALILNDGPYLFCLHLSLFLFTVGLLIYFFNINRAIFGAVVWLIAITTLYYIFFTLTPFSDCDIMFDTPFSSTVLRVYLGVLRAVVQVFSWIKPLHSLSTKTTKHHRDLSDRYRSGILEGNAKLLEEEALKPSSEIDASIVECILLVLGEDHALETFFDAVPGFFGSQLVRPLYSPVTTKLRQSLHSFLDRTFSSRLVPESVKNDRFITCLNAAHSALGSIGASQILDDFFHQHMDEALKSVELGHSLISWVYSTDDSINPIVRRIVAYIITHAKDRDDRWVKLVKEAFDIPDGVIRDYVARGDSMLLAILNHITRQALRTGRAEQQEVLESLSQFDIHNTATELRHEFCALWNEIVQEARNDGFGITHTQILAGIRRLFMTLHRGTNAAPSQFPAPLDSIDDSDPILRWPPLYPSCNISGHHPDSAAQGLAIATPPKSRIRRHSEPVIGPSVVLRPQSSLRLRRTQSYTHFPTVSLPTRPSHPPRSLPRPALVSQPPLSNSPEVVTKGAMPDFADVSGVLHTANPIYVSSTTSGPTVQQVEKTRTTPPSVAPGSLPTPLPTPALSHSATSAIQPSSIDPAAAQTHLHHPPGALTLTATPLSVSLQDTTVSDQQPGLGRTLKQDDTQNSRPHSQKMDPGQPPPGGATVL
jgi:hypothetical protein